MIPPGVHTGSWRLMPTHACPSGVTEAPAIGVLPLCTPTRTPLDVPTVTGPSVLARAAGTAAPASAAAAQPMMMRRRDTSRSFRRRWGVLGGGLTSGRPHQLLPVQSAGGAVPAGLGHGHPPGSPQRNAPAAPEPQPSGG